MNNGLGPASPTAPVSSAGKVYVPKTPEVCTYDTDGNHKSSGRWDYVRDAENRLNQMSLLAAERRLEFTCDYQDRRGDKKVHTRAIGGMLPTDIRFVYDGWNLITEADANDNLICSYAWSHDLKWHVHWSRRRRSTQDCKPRSVTAAKQCFREHIKEQQSRLCKLEKLETISDYDVGLQRPGFPGQSEAELDDPQGTISETRFYIGYYIFRLISLTFFKDGTDVTYKESYHQPNRHLWSAREIRWRFPIH
ncbi:MAG: hypothetical protein M2R45_03489 [Verrucomicrobia subdivision 3 bacterium]|nr:hypothetical protein [Limisphaerales bacterium]MCS1415885.1 hypothetical protein [Limisphaerales bacterium]